MSASLSVLTRFDSANLLSGFKTISVYCQLQRPAVQTSLLVEIGNAFHCAGDVMEITTALISQMKLVV